MVKEKKILIESCPISNEVLRYTASIMSHPLPALLARGVPASLSNDDPALMGQGTSGMTHDFWQALQGWENLGLAGLVSEQMGDWSAGLNCSRDHLLRTAFDGRISRVKTRRRGWMALPLVPMEAASARREFANGTQNGKPSVNGLLKNLEALKWNGVEEPKGAEASGVISVLQSETF